MLFDMRLGETAEFTRCGYEIPGMILLHDLIAVKTCLRSYDFNALTPIVWKLQC